MKKYITLFFFSFILVCTLLYYYFHHVENNNIEFITVQPSYGLLQKSITATGIVEPLDTVSVGAQVSGLISKVYVDFNSIVHKGDLLAQIDSSIMKAQSDQAMANLLVVKSNLTYQKDNFNRQELLLKGGAISPADFQTSLNQFEIAKANLENANAQLKLSKKYLSYTSIYAPISGVVLNRNVSAGQTIASSFNAPVLFVIAKDLTNMLVRANVDEADIGGVEPGQPVSFTVDAYPDLLFKGKVLKIQLKPSTTANVVTYPTLISVENKNMQLKPGMTASINVYTKIDSNALLIPIKAINFKPDSMQLKLYHLVALRNKNPISSFTNKLNNLDFSYSVVWIKSGNKLIQKLVRTGLNDGTQVQVMEGLNPKDSVLLKTITTKEKSTSNVEVDRSPFMPKMQRRKTDSSSKN
jgi:HlyD family secretion protein